jgi:hypothetical protein
MAQEHPDGEPPGEDEPEVEEPVAPVGLPDADEATAPAALPEAGERDAGEAAASGPAGEEAGPARFYITNAERREAGRKYTLTSWLTAAALLEVEWQSESFRRARGSATDRLAETTATVQVGLVAGPWHDLKAEAVLEYDSGADETVADEAFISAEVEAWEVEAGRLYTPLGIYFSHYVSGPLLEFAESRVAGVGLSYAAAERLELKLMGYRGDARPADGGSDGVDWAASLEARLGPGWLLGVSYQSDLADSEEAFLADDDDRYARRVGAAGGYAAWTGPGFDVSLEMMGALRSFRERDRDRDQPFAWNLELAHFAHERFDWALRWEGSRELEDAPHHQVGIAVTWRPVEHASLTVEYLYGWFEGSLATDDEDERYSSVGRVGAMLSVAF